MIQRAIGIAVGALVTLILLVIMAGENPWQDYVTPLVIGGVAAFFWPVVIAFWLGRRAKARREDQVSAEVQRQLDEERRAAGR
jgi:phosphotransferase system  glucose/maltose/N-acetylglucosamine-specific IIC component